MLLDITLFGSDIYQDTVNKELLVHTNDFLITSKHFKGHCDH